MSIKIFHFVLGTISFFVRYYYFLLGTMFCYFNLLFLIYFSFFGRFLYFLLLFHWLAAINQWKCCINSYTYRIRIRKYSLEDDCPEQILITTLYFFGQDLQNKTTLNYTLVIFFYIIFRNILSCCRNILFCSKNNFFVEYIWNKFFVEYFNLF